MLTRRGFAACVICSLGGFAATDAGANFYDERLMVYDRKGKPCLTCGTPIRQGVQAARSTYWCPQCQRG